jgi:hypothetical protein
MMKSRNFIKALRLYSSFIIILIFIHISSKSYGQVLHTESFNVILDSTKRVKGSVVPNLMFQTQKKDFHKVILGISVNF